MSKASQLRKAWGYEGSVPRCANCKSFKQSVIRLTTNSQTVRTNEHCSAGGFTISKNGLCDRWTGIDGSALEGKKL